MSKNALKRKRKQEKWDAEKDDRKKVKKEKRKERKVRDRAARDALLAAGADPASLRPKRQPSSLAPVAVVLDCDFERYMTDKEKISLSGQVTRCYSENKAARHRSHMWVAGWKGALKARYETVMQNQHRKWRDVGFCAGDFVECCREAREKMAAATATGPRAGGEMPASLQRSLDAGVPWTRDEADPFPLSDPEPETPEDLKDIVYLTSESPYTLERLEPNTCYVVGGLVDRNREKGLCYRRARERGVRTAKLPIGQFMDMQSRKVLATNHVVEIMLRWVETESWGEAFAAVIPKRKGGKVKEDGRDEDGSEAEQGDGAAAAEEESDESEAGEDGDEAKQEDVKDEGVKQEIEVDKS